MSNRRQNSFIGGSLLHWESERNVKVVQMPKRLCNKNCNKRNLNKISCQNDHQKKSTLWTNNNNNNNNSRSSRAQLMGLAALLVMAMLSTLTILPTNTEAFVIGSDRQQYQQSRSPPSSSSSSSSSPASSLSSSSSSLSSSSLAQRLPSSPLSHPSSSSSFSSSLLTSNAGPRPSGIGQKEFELVMNPKEINPYYNFKSKYQMMIPDDQNMALDLIENGRLGSFERYQNVPDLVDLIRMSTNKGPTGQRTVEDDDNLIENGNENNDQDDDNQDAIVAPSPLSKTNLAYGIKRSKWTSLQGGWGKRSNQNWNKLSAAWGKRSGNNKGMQGWNNMNGMWGKRAKWNELSGMWGKRAWNDMSGGWGKRQESTNHHHQEQQQQQQQ